MSSIFQNANLTALSAYLPSATPRNGDEYREVFETNRHRVYALAFWMTDNELAAEALMEAVFERVFLQGMQTDAETIDRALVDELSAYMPIGTLTLKCDVSTEVAQVRKNTKRIHLERAVVQLPETERLVFLMHDVEGYSHSRISRSLSISEEQAQVALHASRLRMRELLRGMIE